MFKKLLFLLCLLLTLPVVAQKKDFQVACLNVDGLPPSISILGININLNPDGALEKGSTRIGELVAQKGWDVVALSEDFNYHNYLMEPLNSYYNQGTYRGEVSLNNTKLDGKLKVNTDGLGLLWKKHLTASGETYIKWNKTNGYTDKGSDELIFKGARYYCVKIASGLEVDVYIHHMDAETNKEDNEARESQITQLVDYILASNNKRPIIIMGDTNCRYTRDRLKELLIDRINDDNRFEIHDPWIEFERKGVYPNVGDPAIMTNKEGHQKGEVVDKIFWINNTDANGVTITPQPMLVPNTDGEYSCYIHDVDFSYADGTPISDHYPIVMKFTIEKTGSGVTPGTQYVLRNKGTGQFIRRGGRYGSQGIMDSYGEWFTLEESGEKEVFYPKSAYGYIQYGDVYLDKKDNEKTAWRFSPIAESTAISITQSSKPGMAMGIRDDEGHPVVTSVAYDANDPTQQWELLTKDEYREILGEASETNPIDATCFMDCPDFYYSNKFDSWNFDKASTNAKYEINGPRTGTWSDNHIFRGYNTTGSGTMKSTWTLSTTVNNIPNGKYIVSCQIIGDHKAPIFKLDGGAGEVTIPVEDIEKNGGNKGKITAATAAGYFNEGKYVVEGTVVVNNQSLYISVFKDHTSSATAVCLDNFYLKYLGPTAEQLAIYDRVKAAIDDAQAKADEQGLIQYTNITPIERWEQRNITGNGDEEIKMTYTNLAKASAGQSKIPADMRYTILNNSFELGDLSYWTNNATNARVEKSDAATDGEYLVKADGGELKYTFEVTMPNGIYELKTHVTPGAVIFAEDYVSPAVTGAAGQLTEASLKFIVSKGSATVGVRCDGAFTADNFVLTRVGNQNDVDGYEILSLAIKDATERVNAMGSPYSDDWDLSAYQAMVDNLALEGDGTKEFYEVYELLRAKVYSQPNTDGVSFTNAIINPGFEFGRPLGWDYALDGDTGVKEIANKTYTMSSADGTYLYNTWDENRGTVLKQTIKGLPAGHYRLRATFASDQNNWVYMDANGQKQNFQLSRAKEVGEVLSMEFDVAENTTEVTISVGGCNSDGTYDDLGGTWYKVDKFELTRHGDQKVCFFYDRLQKAITRANEIAAELPKKYSAQWDASDYRDLYDKHIKSGHVADPMGGSNGLAEINELYARLRTLIFSQTEAGADMSGAILNQSFELGDLSGWNTVMPASADTKVVIGDEGGTYGTAGIDGKYLFNSWMNGKANPIWTTTTGVPAGKYRVSAKLASDAGNQFYFVVNGVPSEVITTTGGAEFMTVSMEITLTEETSDLTFGIYPTPNGEFFPENEPLSMGPWFKADDFALTLLQAPEAIEYTPMGQYDTIIMPFDVDMGDDRYSDLAIWEIKSSTEHEFHVQLELVSPDPYELKANVPYIVEYLAYVQPEESEQPEQAPAKRAAAAQADTFTFTGIPTNDSSTYSDASGMLVGSHAEQAPATGEYVMNHNSTVGSAFTRVGEEESPVVAAHRAYISLANANDKITHIVLDAEQNDKFIATGIGSVEITDDSEVEVYNVSGILLRSGVRAVEALEGLEPGLYIIRSGNVTVKSVKK